MNSHSEKGGFFINLNLKLWLTVYKTYVGKKEVEIVERFTHTYLVKYKNGKQSSVSKLSVKFKKIKPQKQLNYNLFDMEVTTQMAEEHDNVISFNYFAFNFAQEDLVNIWKMLGDTSDNTHFKNEYTGLARRCRNDGTYMFYTFFMGLSENNKQRVCEWIKLNYKR